MDNPFDVQTPENLSTSDMTDLFVRFDSDYYQVEKAGHTFIMGPRGAGKSMYFRFLEPDCQCQDSGKQLSALKFYAAYVPIKETDLNLPELFRLEKAKHAALVLNEHAFITHIITKIFVSLRDRAPLPTDDKQATAEMRKFCKGTLSSLLARCGYKGLDFASCDEWKLAAFIDKAIAIFDDIFGELNNYARRIAFVEEIVAYNGPLFGFSDFLAPVIKGLISLSFMPKGPFFLLIDDADNLNEPQTMVLNSWVARRTTGYLCFKIAAQEGEYKTYRAVGGQKIDAPHDYSEFNISDKYTTKSDSYFDRVSEIVRRRLSKFGCEVPPLEFFPENITQEAQILKIAEQLKSQWQDKGTGYRPGDDALRYARPNYIRQLSEGQSKSGSTYSYAGFKQLVHLSSGIVRHLLEMASLMFAETISNSQGNCIKFVPDKIQNKVAREYSDKLLFDEFAKVEKEEGDKTIPLSELRKLRNLIDALGGMFRTILVSQASERRVFSIAFSDRPDDEVSGVFQLGVKYGYFHRATIGNKEGTGRAPLFIMTRRLAPSFKLDPTGFAGYKFVTNEKIKDALYHPKRLVRDVSIKGFDEIMSEPPQGGLFDGQ
jgi:hypothetical protein